MRRKIPSNTALVAFEAAARHGSFARAADELSLTEGAISRQIGRLEIFLGVTLFERIGNRVRLLPHGERYAIQVRGLLDQLDRDSQYLMGQPADGASLDIAALPTFAMRWLIPRLPRFRHSIREYRCISPSVRTRSHWWGAGSTPPCTSSIRPGPACESIRC